MVRESFAAILKTSSPLAVLFYGHLFELDPSLRALFKIDLIAQSKKLTDTLAAVADSLDQFDDMRPRLIWGGSISLMGSFRNTTKY